MEGNQKNGYRILLLEDEFIIAETLRRHLDRNGHRVVGQAVSYAEAVNLVDREDPEVALLDIRVSGSKTGIDFAYYLRAMPEPIPFIFLTSQMDTAYVDQVKQTQPSGYLGKPIQIESLLATIEVVMHNFRSRRTPAPLLALYDGKATHRVPADKLDYVEADHVYVKVYLSDGSSLVLRNTLSDLVRDLGNDYLLQTHRSFAVNPQKITRYDKDYVYIHDVRIPVSRSRRQEVSRRL